MSLAEAFARYLCTVTDTEFGKSMFVGAAPSAKQSQSKVWNVVANGGQPTLQTVNGGAFKDYLVQVFYRDAERRAVYNALYELQLALTGTRPYLTRIDVMSLTTSTLPTDEDIDADGRKVGQLQVTINTYEE